MTPLPFEKVTEKAKSEPSPEKSPSRETVPDVPSQRITILSELDSYIAERMKEQPSELDDAVARIEVQELKPRHRLELPDYFQQHSADAPKHAGPYAFRWVLKSKRSIDEHLAKGWLFVNRSYFPKAPRYLFTANGGVEIGDVILTFLPIKRAKEMREAPAKLSQERLRGQMTQVKPDYVLMTGNRTAGHVYQPELGPESAENAEEKVPGVLTEGRDF